MAEINPIDVTGALLTPEEIVKLVEGQPDQSSSAQTVLARCLNAAAAARLEPAVVKSPVTTLCKFVEQSTRSSSADLRSWAFSHDVALALFNFFLEWNEDEQPRRAVRLVLDQIIALITANPNDEVAGGMKTALLDTFALIISGKSTKPLLKSAMKVVDDFLTKKVLVLDEISGAYNRARGISQPLDGLEAWKQLVLDIFQWMKLRSLCLVAGRLIVTLYLSLLHYEGGAGTQLMSPTVWHQWITEAISSGTDATSLSPTTWKHWKDEAPRPDKTLLEGIQTYVYLPFFISHRPEGLDYLKAINPESQIRGGYLDAASLLQLTALRVGKKQGLVEEAGVEDTVKRRNKLILIPLAENMLDHVVSSASHEARTLALSLIISSCTTTKPFSAKALKLLRQHLGAYFADADAKFRIDTVALMRELFTRLSVVMVSVSRDLNDIKDKRAQAQQPIDASFASGLEPLDRRLTGHLEEHRDFLLWYLNFLKGELVPTASYQRHITALKALSNLLKAEQADGRLWEIDGLQYFQVFDETWRQALLDLMMDPFDDVRATSCIVLDHLFSEKRFARFTLTRKHLVRSPAVILEEFLALAGQVATLTARADHADGVSRTCRLLYRNLEHEETRMGFVDRLVKSLQEKISLAARDLGRAVLEAPVHADFAALRQVWQSIAEKDCSAAELERLGEMPSMIVSCCRQIWTTVKHVLCDDSPEGRLSHDVEEMEGPGTKEILGFSFQAVQESSNLMKTMVLGSNPSSQGKGNGRGTPPNFETLSCVGDLSFEQLSTLRHRGALSTVALTFAACCEAVEVVENPQRDQETETLLEAWYKKALHCVHEPRPTTRRSAGIPPMMIGILSAISANTTRPLFDMVMVTLMKIARLEAQETDDGPNISYLPQTHAHNCLREIFQSSLLAAKGNKLEPYLFPCLELAAKSLNSEVWAIRNCGLILIRGLTDSIFSNPGRKLSIEAGWDGRAPRTQYHKWPALPGMLVELLRDSGRTATAGLQVAESVFPVLDIVRRAGPPDAMREELQLHIVALLASPVWHIREIAARALCSCLLHGGWLDVIEGCLRSALRGGEGDGGDDGGARNNQLHGAYLALRFIIEKMVDVMREQITEKWDRLVALFRHLDDAWPDAFTSCPHILAAHLEVINLLLSPQLAAALPAATAVVGGGVRDASVFIPTHDLRTPTALQAASPVLEAQIAKLTVHIAARSRNTLLLRESMRDACAGTGSTAAAGAMLQAVSAAWPRDMPAAEALQLLGTYTDAVLLSTDSGIQAVALDQLADFLDMVLLTGITAAFPDKAPLVELWHWLAVGPVNAGLSNVIVRCSGAILAVIGASEPGIYGSPDVAAWGGMVASAGDYEQDLDARLAAATSLKYLIHALPSSSSPYPDLLPPKYLPPSSPSSPSSPYHPALLTAIIALYDALGDDDDRVRDVAASAASALLDGRVVVPVEASTALLAWTARHFGHRPEFRRVVLGRVTGMTGMTGMSSGSSDSGSGVSLNVGSRGNSGGGSRAKSQVPPPWERVRTQLERAMTAITTTTTIMTTTTTTTTTTTAATGSNELLFAAEEHNLFVDEVRETRRWTDVLVSLYSGGKAGEAAEAPPIDDGFDDEEEGGDNHDHGNKHDDEKDMDLRALHDWTATGLQDLLTMIRAQGEEERGRESLGWTSRPAVFAVCARVIVAASVVSKLPPLLLPLPSQGPDAPEQQELLKALGDELPPVLSGLLHQTMRHGVGSHRVNTTNTEVNTEVEQP